MKTIVRSMSSSIPGIVKIQWMNKTEIAHASEKTSLKSMLMDVNHFKRSDLQASRVYGVKVYSLMTRNLLFDFSAVYTIRMTIVI